MVARLDRLGEPLSYRCPLEVKGPMWRANSARDTHTLWSASILAYVRPTIGPCLSISSNKPSLFRLALPVVELSDGELMVTEFTYHLAGPCFVARPRRSQLPSLTSQGLALQVGLVGPKVSNLTSHVLTLQLDLLGL